MAGTRLKRPRDPLALAKLIGDIATGQTQDVAPGGKEKDPAAVERGRLGGLKGGKARAANMTAKERKASARKAIRSRWARQS